MIYSVVINLQAEGDPAHSAVSGHHILGFFLNLIRRADTALAEELHRDTAVKPFTLSHFLPFSGRSPRTAGKGPLSFRITMLDERVFTALADAVWRLPPDDELPLGNLRVRCHSLETIPAQSVWANFTTLNQLLENAAGAKVRLSFLSATTFRSGGRRNVLFPEPALVFGSLLNRWNAIAAADCKLDLPEQLLSKVRISNYRLSTRLMDFGSYEELGFSGQVTYDCDIGIPVEQVKTLNALADFAFYAGIGAKTTMGMGQCRRSDYARALPYRTGSDPEKRR